MRAMLRLGWAPGVRPWPGTTSLTGIYMEEEGIGEHWLCNDVSSMCSWKASLKRLCHYNRKGNKLSHAELSQEILKIKSLSATDLLSYCWASSGLLIAHSKATRRKNEVPSRPHRDRTFVPLHRWIARAQRRRKYFLWGAKEEFHKYIHAIYSVAEKYFWKSTLLATVTSARYTMKNSQGAFSSKGKRVNKQIINKSIIKKYGKH